MPDLLMPLSASRCAERRAVAPRCEFPDRQFRQAARREINTRVDRPDATDRPQLWHFAGSCSLRVKCDPHQVARCVRLRKRTASLKSVKGFAVTFRIVAIWRAIRIRSAVSQKISHHPWRKRIVRGRRLRLPPLTGCCGLKGYIVMLASIEVARNLVDAQRSHSNSYGITLATMCHVNVERW
jgi:hypothetical protein